MIEKGDVTMVQNDDYTTYTHKSNYYFITLRKRIVLPPFTRKAIAGYLISEVKIHFT